MYRYIVQMLRILLKKHAKSPPRGKFVGKIPNFDSFKGCIPTFLP